MGLLNHPNILAVHDTGHHEGSPYVVSELLEGQTLRERAAGGALPLRKAVEIGAQIARGLAAAFVAGRRGSTYVLPEFRPVTFQRGFVEASRFAADAPPSILGRRAVAGELVEVIDPLPTGARPGSSSPRP